jgi:hypothetical protein
MLLPQREKVITVGKHSSLRTRRIKVQQSFQRKTGQAQMEIFSSRFYRDRAKITFLQLER